MMRSFHYRIYQYQLISVSVDIVSFDIDWLDIRSWTILGLRSFFWLAALLNHHCLINQSWQWLHYQAGCHSRYLKNQEYFPQSFCRTLQPTVPSCAHRHSYEYLLNFRNSVPNLSTAVHLSQLLSTVALRGGHRASYREQTGQCHSSANPRPTRPLQLLCWLADLSAFQASLAKLFLSQDWVTASGEKERGSKFNEALHSVLRFVILHKGCFIYLFF